MLKQILLIVLFSLASIFVHAQFSCQDTKANKTSATATPPINNNGKSDTLDILHFDLEFDMTQIQNGLLTGVAELTIVCQLNNIFQVNLDFLALNIDSVKFNDSLSCTYSFNNGPHFPVYLPDTLNSTDTFTLAIYYYGSPVQDASGWGGFHLNSPYFYNLGVGFAANPHTFGRAWFPCFDNFVEKSTFSFHVKTAGGRKAFCNGIRTSIDTSSFGGDTIVSHWSLIDPIPPYLASIAISDYEELTSTHANMPFILLAREVDTNKAKGSFANLPAIYDNFVTRYGPYFWQKVGYAVTPLGAMEHATSIHYPRSDVNGNLSSEDLIAHELFHHWFGNLVTCETAGDMWINEGLAEYASNQYLEDLKGYSDYMDAVIANHFYVMRQAHITDDGYHALYNLPNELTYGDHTYQKGAMVGHNLRGYLGDSDFFSGLTTLLANNKYGNLNSIQFRDQLSQITGYNLNSFFADWVFDAGYPDFNIDSMQVITNALPEKTVNIRVSQRMLATTKRFTNVPLTLTFHDAQWNTASYNVLFTNADTIYTLLVPFHPTWATINENNKVLIGVTVYDETLTSNVIRQNTKGLMDVYVTANPDSARLRVEHHWAGPSATGNENFRLSSARYWRVTGTFPAAFQANAKFQYISSASNAYLDEDLLANGEDSLILVYRKDASHEWAEYGYYHKDVMGSPNNKIGRMYIHSLIPGEFAMANGKSMFKLEENLQQPTFTLFPNPATDSIIIEHEPVNSTSQWTIRDVKGRVLLTGDFKLQTESTQISISSLAAGTYFFCTGNATQKFIVQ